MTAHRLIVVPYELGRLRDGVGRGPERLLEAGAEAALAASGGPVRTELVEIDASWNATGVGEVDACFELIRRVAQQVRSFDPPEVARLEASSVTYLRPAELGRLVGALRRSRSRRTTRASMPRAGCRRSRSSCCGG